MRIILVLFGLMTGVFAANCGAGKHETHACCKICKNSKACGNACIDADAVCKAGTRGCACDATG